MPIAICLKSLVRNKELLKELNKFKYDFLKYENTFFKNTPYSNSMNTCFQNTNCQRANTSMLVQK